MPRTVAEIASQIRTALRLSEPDLDTSIGQPTRKMIDAFAEVIAEAEVDKYLLDYGYDVDAKRGADLDEFVRLFSFNRLPAKRATGTVTFERQNPGTVIFIPYGTQLATDDIPAVVVTTVVPAVMSAADTSISVPVQAVLGGSGGNIAANSVTRAITSVAGIVSLTNPSPLTGGADEESDEQLRLRFKKTVFRNMAGTEQMFLGIALEDAAVTHANVVGPVKRFREQVEVVGGTAVSTIQDAKMVYAGSSVFGANIDGGQILSPQAHYSFNIAGTPGDPPSITILDPARAPDGIYDLEFEYVSAASRNDPPNGITNRVDVYVSGQRAEEATEVTLFRTARRFSATPGDPYYVGKFRTNDGQPPVANDWFIPLTFVPIISLPASLILNGLTFHYDGAPPSGSPSGLYKLVWDETADGQTPRSLAGLLIEQAFAGTVPPDNTAVSINYIFNAVPRDVEAAIRQWRLLTTDVRVHEAKRIEMRVNLVVILAPGYTEATVRPEIEYVVGQYLARIDFNGVAQTSDVLGAVHAISGVDAVRFTTQADNVFDMTYGAGEQVWAWERLLTASGGEKTTETRYASGGRAIDAFFGDDELPVLNNVTIDVRAQNTYGIG